MVVDAGDTVMLVPVPKKVPPQEPLYHWTTAPVPNVPPVAVRVVLLPLQMVVVPLIPVGATDNTLAVPVTLSCRLPVEELEP